jgi:hypothetical protein
LIGFNAALRAAGALIHKHESARLESAAFRQSGTIVAIFSAIDKVYCRPSAIAIDHPDNGQHNV